MWRSQCPGRPFCDHRVIYPQPAFPTEATVKYSPIYGDIIAHYHLILHNIWEIIPPMLLFVIDRWCLVIARGPSVNLRRMVIVVHYKETFDLLVTWASSVREWDTQVPPQ